MGKNAPFGRPGASDQLRLWWHGTSKTTRSNALLFLVVGTISVALVWAGVSRDVKRPQGLANASPPRLTAPPTLATIPTPLDLTAAGAGPAPTPVADPGGTTTTTTSGTVPPSTSVGSSPPTTVAPSPPITASSSSPVTTVANGEVVFTTVPAPAPEPDPTVPPLPSSSVPDTTPPTSAPPVTSPPSPPPSSAPPTTSATLLPPLPFELPPLLGS